MSSSVVEQTNGRADLKGDFTANEALKQLFQDRGMVANLLSLRRDWLRTINDPRRDINKECGYPETSSLDRIKYKDMYDRNPIAARAVEVLPKECWQVEPSVYEKENVKTRTAFEDSWNNLPKTLRGRSFANTEECGNPVWGYLRRLDILSGIGQFAVMLIGTNDGKSLKEPHEGVETENETVTFNATYEGKASKTAKTTQGTKRKLTYLRVFDESLVTVATWDNEPTSVRYQQPNSYNITMNDTKLNAGIGVSASEKPSSETVEVHWTRVIHVADNLTTSEIFGNSRLMKIYNRCLDLEKVTGGSGEMFWKQAGGLYSLETHPQNVDASFNKTDVKDQFEKLFNSLDRFVGIEGATVKSIAPTVADPTNQVNVAIEAICIEKGCPVRIFKGSERGELASSQDDGAWNDRLRERQSGHITPHIVIPFIDRLIQMGVLEAPGDKGYKVYWPDLESINEKDKAAIAVQKTQALTNYIGGGGDGLVEPLDYLTKFLGMEDDVAQGIVDNKMKTIEEEDTGDSPLLGMVGGLTGFTDILAKATSGELTPQQAMKTLMVFFGMSEAQAEDAVAEDSIDEADEIAQENDLAQLDAQTQITTPPPVSGQPVPGQKGFPPQKGQFPPTGNVDSDIYDEDWEPTTDELVSVNTEDSEGSNPFQLTDNDVNCGIGKGGFQRGNQCAAGGTGGKAKFVGQRVGAAEHKAADQVSNSLAKSLGGKVEEQTGGPGQRDKKPYDVRVKRKGGDGYHDIEVKSMLKGSKTSISVHDDALLRKVEHQKQNPSNLFHTVVVDKRKSYDGGAYADNYSGHEIYYKRGSGAYALSKMHKVKNPAELKKLLDMDMKDLPKEARGKLPPPPPPAKLRASADKASEARKARDQARKLRMRDVLREQARARRMAQKAGDTNA